MVDVNKMSGTIHERGRKGGPRKGGGNNKEVGFYLGHQEMGVDKT